MQLRISEGLEATLAPALLPRTPLQHALLLAIKQASRAGDEDVWSLRS
jgi:uncharacterized membrane protein